MNYIQAYREFSKVTEPPELFHLWSMIASASTLLGKKVYLDHGHFIVYTNTMIVLVGPASSRKSTASKIARDVVRTLDNIPMSPSTSSKEALIDTMADSKVCYKAGGKDMFYCQSAAFANEFSTFMGGKHISEGMVNFLTDIWDEDVKYTESTRKGGIKAVLNPYFTLLGCCVPAWFSDQVKDNVITGGFARRTIFVYGDRLDQKVSWPELEDFQTNAWNIMCKEAKRIHSLKGEFQVTKDVKKLHHKFYCDLQDRIPDIDLKFQQYYSSKHILVLKICMIISACLDSSKLVTPEIYTYVQDLMLETEKGLKRIYGNIGKNELKPMSEKILQALERAKRQTLTRKRLLATFYDDITSMELDTILQDLVSMEFVSVSQPGSVSEASAGLSYSLTREAVRAQKVHLFQQACQLKSSSAPSSAESPPSDVSPRVLEAVEQLERSRSQIELEVVQGILLKGMPPVHVFESDPSLKKG